MEGESAQSEPANDASTDEPVAKQIAADGDSSTCSGTVGGEPCVLDVSHVGACEAAAVAE